MTGTKTGRVILTLPSVVLKSGAVNTSSVGIFGANSIPRSVTELPPCHIDLSLSPILRSVPGPLKQTSFNLRLFKEEALLFKVLPLFTHAADGSSSSSVLTLK